MMVTTAIQSVSIVSIIIAIVVIVIIVFLLVNIAFVIVVNIITLVLMKGITFRLIHLQTTTTPVWTLIKVMIEDVRLVSDRHRARIRRDCLDIAPHEHRERRYKRRARHHRCNGPSVLSRLRNNARTRSVEYAVSRFEEH